MKEDSNIMFTFNIDRGGTFTDFYVIQQKSGSLQLKTYAFKVLSKSFRGQGPIVGIRQFLVERNFEFQGKIPVNCIKRINLGTTIVTNAILEKKGCKCAAIVTKGFLNLLQIRHQARPNIFDITCKKNPPLYSKVFEIDERVYLSQINFQTIEIQRNVGHIQKIFCKAPLKEEIELIAKKLKQQQIQSVAVSLCNSYIYSPNQQFVKKVLLENGIKHVEIGSKYQDLGYVKRSQTVVIDSFLNPQMSQYFKNFLSQFSQPSKIDLRIMKSDGGFARPQDVNASQLLLSGPVAGLIGYSKLIDLFQQISGTSMKNLIGVDMGGTSTDVSRVNGSNLQTIYNFQVQDMEICTPHLVIDTIAAGGGSQLSFQNGMFKVGPQSVGSNPGPVCYGIGNQLALTDANIILNRLQTENFPKIFGQDGKSPLNIQKTFQRFIQFSDEICKISKNQKTLHEIAEGFIEIANQKMAQSTRKLLTLGRPDALVMFGSAGGQHCCALARKIGVEHIFIHKYSGILSAYGLSKASTTKQVKIFLGKNITKDSFNYEKLKEEIRQKLTSQQTNSKRIQRQIAIKYKGTYHNIMVEFTPNLIEDFIKIHRQQNGFSLQQQQFYLDFYVSIIYDDQQFKQEKLEHLPAEPIEKFDCKIKKIYLQGVQKEVPVYKFNQMKNCKISGPALLLSETSSILVQSDWVAHITNLAIYIKKKQNCSYNKEQKKSTKICDPIKLTLYSTRLMSIAQQMGKVLQKISISTNIKQRRDFSCGIFDSEGKLLANAPHLPVHLGSMQTAVIEQINRGMKQGDVILSNHPIAGGSHLPDLTVISCIRINQNIKLYVASRGHHADIGGISPGSMPPFSKTLDQEGVTIQTFKLIQNNHFKQKELRQLFKTSRRINDNVSDIKAQVAANQIGSKLLSILVKQSGDDQFKQYLNFICENANQSVKDLLREFSIINNMKLVDSVENIQYMDDGTPLKLKMSIDRQQRTAIFDFSGTGQEIKSNTNAPKSITRSAILYCLRCLIGKEIPLNSGCLKPLQIIVPENSILNPSKNAAVVGGNVQTSQRIVDLIFKPFKRVAASQGTMNNFLFGNQNCAYYQTICGGSGAGQGFNGTTTQCHMTNTRITDVQFLQMNYPIIVTQFKKRTNSGGRGKYIGGQGVIRQFLFLQSMNVSILSERRVMQPYGLNGGENGSKGKNTLIRQNNEQIILQGKSNFDVKKFQRVRIETPGGGGYGKY